ncbi:MAG: PA0069 family radical SAM protein [Burkholderiales bacterium]|nr:PA0069 family radical SAM protein [Burkholderiales bacterium]
MPLKTTAGDHGAVARGRGATMNPEGRFEKGTREAFDDDWFPDGREGEAAKPGTVVAIERAKRVISRNDSPDLGFSLSVNPYRGCAHGCSYCYARPSHAYLGLSPGIDFETRLFAKPEAAQLLREELARPGYRCEPINIGSNTDGYQPIESEHRITRSVLEVLREASHPVTIVTKSALVERDLDLLAPMARDGLATVVVSVTTLDPRLSARMEPRASAPARRLEAIRRLAAAGVPVGVNVAPVIPFLTDHEIEAILAEAARAGAGWAGWSLLRLPWEVKDIFRAWLEHHVPLKAAHVMARVNEMRGGRDNDPRFGTRMTGEGLLARLVRRRVAVARGRLGLAGSPPALACDRFRPPGEARQPSLF